MRGRQGGSLFWTTKLVVGPFLGTSSQRLCMGQILRDAFSPFLGRGTAFCC